MKITKSDLQKIIKAEVKKVLANTDSEIVLKEVLAYNKNLADKMYLSYDETSKNIEGLKWELHKKVGLAVDTYKIEVNDHGKPEVLMKWNEPLDESLIDSIDEILKIYKKKNAIIDNPSHSSIGKNYFRVSFW